jgi:NhaA family Na+:H+ antiporter
LAGIGVATFLQPITLGVAGGLFLGKQLGIFGACWLGVKTGLGKLPAGTSWTSLYGVSLLCGIGFTISLFIGALAFQDDGAVAAAKLGVIAGSLVSGIAGWLVLRQSGRNIPEKPA